jgi:hypothetical protein
VNPVLRRLRFRHLLEEQPRPGTVGIDQRGTVVAVLGRDAPGVERGVPRVESRQGRPTTDNGTAGWIRMRGALLGL